MHVACILLLLLLFYPAIVGFRPAMAPSRAPVSTIDPERVASIMLSWHSLALVSITKVQTLWAGYGFICAVTARTTSPDASSHLAKLGVHPAAPHDTYQLILKLISPPTTNAKQLDEGHLRKMLSYEVEQYFYNRVAPHLEDDVAVAKCLATTLDMEGKIGAEELHGLIATVMTDLRPEFPVAGYKRSQLNPGQVSAALQWLAKFHRSSWRWLPDSLTEFVPPPLDEAKRRNGTTNGAKPVDRKLWLNGGYTYLATRRSEYASLVEDTDSEWSTTLCRPLGSSSSSIAERAAEFLTPRGRPFETYIHGDVKSENLFTTASGDRVAFYDFQYVGLGLGVSDLAKFFTSSVPLNMLIDDGEPIPDELTMSTGERRLLEQYRDILLRDATDPNDGYDWEVFVRHWQTALVDWLRFQASWGFWGNTEWLEARVRSTLSDQGWIDWLLQNSSKS